MSTVERLRPYAGARVLVTGHTGFKGTWLTLWLRQLGARVTGLSPARGPTRSLYDEIAWDGVRSIAGDVTDPGTVAGAVGESRPDIVFHLAAKSLVATGAERPADTVATNVVGTVQVLEAVRRLGDPVAVVAVSSDKCYAPDSDRDGYREEDRLGGHDVYSASKACMEIMVEAYRRSLLAGTGVRVASTRAGNVIGGGDWSADRLVPDVARAALRGDPIRLRASAAVRPWQHVLEALGGYLLVGAELLRGTPGVARPWNFGPDPALPVTVGQLVQALTGKLGGRVEFVEAPVAASESRSLRLRSDRAAAELNWRPVWTLDNAVLRTADWYRSQHEGARAEALCVTDIRDYEAAAAVRWAS